MEKRRVGKICVSKEVLLELLSFGGGTLHNIGFDPEIWQPDAVQLVIEHPDMPEVDAGATLQPITPLYVQRVEVVGGEEYSRVERIEPKHRED